MPFAVAQHDELDLLADGARQPDPGVEVLDGREVVLAGERHDDVALLQAGRARGLAAVGAVAPVDEVVDAEREAVVGDAEPALLRGGQRGAAEAGRRRQVPLVGSPREVGGIAALPARGQGQHRMLLGAVAPPRDRQRTAGGGRVVQRPLHVGERAHRALRAEREQFVFLLDLGPIPAERQHKVYELLLRFSYLWRDSGGLHMAMNDAGNAVLMFKYPLLGLNVTRLHTLLGNLLNHARRWRELIQHPPQTDEDETERPTAVDLPPFGGIRV